MGNKIIEPDGMEHLLLYLAEADWLPIGSASAYAGDLEKDVPTRKIRLVAAVRALAADGFIQIGDLEYRDPKTKTGLHWEEWPGTLDEQMQRLIDVYTPEVQDDTYWYYACWLSLTESGEHLLHTLPQPDDRFFKG